MTKKVASFLVPLLAAAALLYRGAAGLHLRLAQVETLLVSGLVLAAGVAAGLAAACVGERTRVVVLGLTTVLLLDMTIHPSWFFDALSPLRRLAPERDTRRIADLHRIQEALETYVREVGPLPEPAAYGEGMGPATFWPDWWDLSSRDKDGDGRPFLDFLEERGIPVPVDPLNSARDTTDPRSGHQYVYFVIPPGYEYRGGVCPDWSGRWVYLLALTRLETETVPPPPSGGPGCECLWRDEPGFFQHHFAYTLCGTFQR